MARCIFYLNILLILFLSLIFAQLDDECSERTFDSSNNACETDFVTYDKLIGRNTSCSNLYLLGFVSTIEKYVLFTTNSTIIFYGHKTDISEKEIPLKCVNMKGVKIITAVIKENIIFLQIVASNKYYILVLSNLEGKIKGTCYPAGEIARTVYIHNCRHFYVIKTNNNTVVQKEMKYDNNTFSTGTRNYSISYSENVESLTLTNLSTINVKIKNGETFKQSIADFDEETTIIENDNVFTLERIIATLVLLFLLFTLIGTCLYIILLKKKSTKFARNTPESIPLQVIRKSNSHSSLTNINDSAQILKTGTVEANIYLPDSQTNDEQPSNALGYVSLPTSSVPSSKQSTDILPQKNDVSYERNNSNTKMAIKNLQNNLLITSKISIVPENFKNEKLDWNTKILLNSSEFGNVYKCIYKDGDKFRQVAVKQLNRAADEPFKEEIIMSRLKNHPHVVKLITTRLDGDMLLIMPLLECNLSEYLHSQPNLTLTHKIRYCQQIAIGMSYLMCRQILHCDLKASNILVVDENLVQISDFGKSEQLSDITESKDVIIGTITHAAMELLDPFKRMLNCEATDVWSFGVTIWEIFNVEKHIPYADCVSSLTVATILSYLHEDKNLTTAHWPEDWMQSDGLTAAESYMRKCLHRDQKERPSFGDLWLSFYMFLPEGRKIVKTPDGSASSGFGSYCFSNKP